ncbi:MAG TPA: GIY-YIG nuclease family protein [Nitrososphaera sp.]|jgi:group I intron endonuclease|nr:GIY-YIG nuclease family protein [Nitrososphaera sp.]
MGPLYHSHQSASIPTTSGIYCITCTSNKKIYIGSAVNLRYRWHDHCKTLRSNSHRNSKLQNAWNKYGEQVFTFEVIEFVLVPELLTAREQHWFDALQPFKQKGFNIAVVAGSPLGIKRSPETLEKMRTASLGRKLSLEARDKMSQAHKGRKHSLKTREKMHLAALGRVQGPETRAKIGAANKGNPSNLGRTFPPHIRENMSKGHTEERKSLIVTSPDGIEQLVHGIRPFCKEHHLAPSALRRVAQGKQQSHKGWKARFPD